MKIDVAAVRKCLKSFDFNTLFREHLGWDKHQAQLDIPVDGSTIRLIAVAQKRGFTAYVCDSIPDRPTRLKIDHQVTKTAREHFVIYADQGSGQQVWQWVRREPGKPLASRDHRFNVSSAGDALIQRLERIAVTLDEEEILTVVDVVGRARAAFDVDKVTKKFYERFKAEHAAFLKFIKGIKAEADLEWYTSLMLNRLMFVYFIQKKGFLDGDSDYLRNRMRQVRELKGKDKFQSFYRYFLVRLFHDGLGKHKDDRRLDRELEKLLGKVPYLNGGFFEVHQLEERNTEIDIPDKAFENLFDFFDEFSWHLDERPLRAGNEINPDVVGYIFEKYVNQKQMGAYYTKEDITEYISKNTIIPFLFDAAQKKCPIAFRPESFLWRLLRDDPDRYIYAAVRHGVVDSEGKVIPLPKEIEAGIKDVSKRDGWNRAAADPYALPTETWREHVTRRLRCLELRDKLSRGEVHVINDLITLNLDIWQFARDAIVNSEGPELLRAFWQAIAGRTPEKSNEKFEPGITVLDPTCGSGAFLFAALRILETLYSDCLERMERFVEDEAGGNHQPAKFSDFKHILAEIAKHPGDRYFILKSIIISNLFGVDIMEEAVEICKLRLFLKLVAQVERVEQIEPLPDIDFNIRAGNTLVGYVSLAEIKKSQSGTLGFGASEIESIEEDAMAVEKCFEQFRAKQTNHGGKVTAKDKAELRKRLAKLDAELDRYLAGEYGIDAKGKNAGSFDQWKATHQPFHWLVEFYGIMSAGGFDAIIGNPPYVEYRESKVPYIVRGLNSLPSKNLYAYCTEQSIRILSTGGRIGVILPLAATTVTDTESLRALLLSQLTDMWHSSYGFRPSKLFDGVNLRLLILMGSKGTVVGPNVMGAKYAMFSSEERDTLFRQLSYMPTSPQLADRFPKTCVRVDAAILQKMTSTRPLADVFLKKNGPHKLVYHRSPLYWIRALDFEPYFESATKERSVHHLRDLYLTSADAKSFLGCIVNSSLYFWWFTMLGNCRNLTGGDIASFPCGSPSEETSRDAATLFRKLMADYKQKADITVRYNCKYQTFYPGRSKDLLDEIDFMLAKHYGLSEEQLDYITNFAIKYRVGNEDAGEDE